MISFLNKSQSIVDPKGIMDIRFRNWADAVTRLQILEGEGSPENVIGAARAELYMDINGITGSILYIKREDDIDGDPTRGWILV